MPDCKTCKENRQNVEPVPYIVHESAMARQERTIKRLWIALLVSICLWAATVGGVIYYEAQFVDESVWQEVDPVKRAATAAIVNARCATVQAA